MALVPAPVVRPRMDTFFLAEFRDHVGRSLVCGCNLEGPDRDCDLGTSLWNVAVRGDWEDRKARFLRRGKTGSP